MATTFTLISSNTLSGSASSVSFTSIPATYTDLMILVSARTSTASTIESCYVQFNSDTATNYSYVLSTGNGSAPSSNIYSSQNYIGSIPADAASAASSVFASWEIYVPSYLASSIKPVNVYGVQENNTTTAYIRPIAGLWQGTSAITTVTFTGASGGNFISGSSFYLYGIKNS